MTGEKSRDAAVALKKYFLIQAALTTSQWSAELGRVHKQHMNYSAKYVAYKDTQQD